MKKNALAKLIGFCFCLLVARIVVTDHVSFLFLVWNLFLAWIPYYFVLRSSRSANRAAKLIFFLLSILFLPNAPYIVTDLFHLKKALVAPIWLDVILILSFAMAGLCFFILTVKAMLKVAHPGLSTVSMRTAFKILVIFLSSYGVYLGRYQRFNSWDIVADPFHLFYSLSRSLLDYNYARETLPMILTFSVFLWIIYEAYENIQQPASDPRKHIEEKN